MRLIPALLVGVLTVASSAFARGETAASTITDDFNALFVTAGYSTVLGAALGTAALAFTPNPKQNVRYITLGAAGGFIFGTLLGTYLVFSPPKSHSSSRSGKGRDDDDLEGFSQQKVPEENSQALLSPSDFSVYPELDLAEGRLKSWRADWVIARF